MDRQSTHGSSKSTMVPRLGLEFLTLNLCSDRWATVRAMFWRYLIDLRCPIYGTSLWSMARSIGRRWTTWMTPVVSRKLLFLIILNCIIVHSFTTLKKFNLQPYLVDLFITKIFFLLLALKPILYMVFHHLSSKYPK